MITVGRITLNEAAQRAFEESWNEEGSAVSLSGIEYSEPSRPRAVLSALHDDIVGLPLSVIPVSFGTKSTRDGYYLVTGSGCNLTELDDQAVALLSWKIELRKLGNDSAVDVESKLAGPINRLNDHSLGGERWHAPAGLHTAYLSGTDTPGQVIRTGADGPIRVYRGLSIVTNPRWACTVQGYALGRVRLISPTFERAGSAVDLNPVEWQISNSLIRLNSLSNGNFEISAHNGASWSTPKLFRYSLSGSAPGVPVAASILYNEYDRVTIRLVWDRSPSGRLVGDVTLRRGSRFVEFILKCLSAATLGLARVTSEAGTQASGFVHAAANDGDGHRYIIGSSKSFTANLAIGAITKSSVTRFDGFIGLEVAGTAAVAGDIGTDLMLQYLGSPSEVVQVVKR